MHGFGLGCPEIEHGFRASEVGFGMAFLGANKVRKFKSVADKENGRVITHHIPVTLLSIKFKAESTHITFGVGRARLSGYR